MYDREYTPDRITELKQNEIFVFGSNLAGSHGGGAARLAYNRFGAIWGQGVGLQGQSYAIPTMQGGVETIEPYVEEEQCTITKLQVNRDSEQYGCKDNDHDIALFMALLTEEYGGDAGEY